MQESINTRKGVERCLRYAFEYTRKRNRRKTLTLCGKTNVLTYAFDLWERAFHEVGAAPTTPTSSATTRTSCFQTPSSARRFPSPTTAPDAARGCGMRNGTALSGRLLRLTFNRAR